MPPECRSLRFSIQYYPPRAASPGAHAHTLIGRYHCEAVDEQSGQSERALTRQDMSTTLTHFKVSTASQFNKVIFKDKADAAIDRRMVSLFPGLGYAAAYKVRDIHVERNEHYLTHGTTRSSSGCTSMAVNRSCGTTYRRTTGRRSTGHSARVMGRR